MNSSYNNHVMEARNRPPGCLVQNLINQILNNPDEPLDEEKLAERVEYSVTHIRRVFSEVMGESLGDFMRRVRLERAAGLLSTSDLPISTVAKQVNYDSGESFARAFRSRFQNPPSVFRALNQGESHLLPGYLYASNPAPANGPMQVGLFTAADCITTTLYEGIAIVGQIHPDEPPRVWNSGSSEPTDQGNGRCRND